MTDNFVIFGKDGRRIEFARPAVMAILNATPDSFSDGGEIAKLGALQKRIKQVISQGADIIDVGGESTRPGYDAVSITEEISRIEPVIRTIREINQNIPISIDTRKSEVARTALQVGADFVNDVSGLMDKNMAGVVADHKCSIVLMRHQPLQPDLVQSCTEQTGRLIEIAQKHGILAEQILLDPGLGFGDLETQDFKSLPGGDVAANLELIQHISSYGHNQPVVVGASRKRFVGQLSAEEDAKNRLAGSITIAYLAFKQGASIVRAHDISQTVQVRDIVISNM